MVTPLWLASTTCPAEELSVSVRASRYSAEIVISFLRVAVAPMSGANFSVIATDEILYGEDGMGLPVSSSSV